MRIAVTGGIAEGKSTVLSYVAALGYETASADAFAREAFDDPGVNWRIARLIGSEHPARREDVLEAISFDDSLRRGLNRIMHPVIRERLRTSTATFLEIPLLIETCSQGLYDGVWVVTCGPDEQRERLVRRVEDVGLAESLLNLQLPTQAKVPFSDRVIRTNEPPDRVREIVEKSVKAVFGT